MIGSMLCAAKVIFAQLSASQPTTRYTTAGVEWAENTSSNNTPSDVRLQSEWAPSQTGFQHRGHQISFAASPVCGPFSVQPLLPALFSSIRPGSAAFAEPGLEAWGSVPMLATDSEA